MHRKRSTVAAGWIVAGLLTLASGCFWSGPKWNFHKDQAVAHYQAVATEIEYPTVPPTRLEEVDSGVVPHSIRDADKVQYWDLTLDEVIQLALTNSRVLQDLGGTILRVPEAIRSTSDPSIQETDPLYGVESALAAFDAQFSSGLFFERNDRRYNNQAVGGVGFISPGNTPGGFFNQEYDTFQAQIQKRAATGSLFTIRNLIDFDRNNSSANTWSGGAWDSIVEGELRQPLLRGAGVEYNRIAGPNGRPGIINGVLIARMRTDIALADFELGVRDFVANVENAYWDLYYAYRDLDAKVKARNAALETWRKINSLHQTGQRGGEADKEAQAREQYFRFEEEVQTALTGRLIEGTRTNNGTSPGTFRASPGVYVTERRLRLLMGLPLNDCQVIRPAEEPSNSPVSFDWCAVTGEALVYRAELRRQRWTIKTREMELLASRNFLLPNLDFVGRYRFRGFGQNLIGPDQMPYDSSLADLGRFQEWQMGMEFVAPLGFREGHSALRNAELRLIRARCVLREQEKQIIHDLSAAVAEVERAYVVLQTSINRVVAAAQQLDAVQAAYDAGPDTKMQFWVVLDSQRRLADAEISYYQTRVEYSLAVRNVFFEKGTLLDDCGIVLSEGPWCEKAYHDAADREHRRGRPHAINYAARTAPLVSNGPCPPQ